MNKLLRRSKNRLLGGVCGGFANWLDMFVNPQTPLEFVLGLINKTFSFSIVGSVSLTPFTYLISKYMYFISFILYVKLLLLVIMTFFIHL